ncbi:hypothetical protein GCM10010399_69140 [Dactylosporangium fulvum]|uniref:Secreted protein n=1 Tax=Dactylosporangium fulvum TaxID=53359 RepID=A0ABY5VLR0_9ACTN|nr:hypothetical protein [Dactylosporangium fulvum]UWP78428.1 hypothetical protein Dfulv_24885 [Dactylosporangium fulvum]
MRRTIVKLLGISLAAAALVTYVNWVSDRDAKQAGDPTGRLSCGDTGRISGAHATASPTSRETRTPTELADAWARARSAELASGQRRLYQDDKRVDIGFDSRSKTVAVLTFRSYDSLGWHLDAVVACQSVSRPS